jgi:hypothetical protein
MLEATLSSNPLALQVIGGSRWAGNTSSKRESVPTSLSRGQYLSAFKNMITLTSSVKENQAAKCESVNIKQRNNSKNIKIETCLGILVY